MAKITPFYTTREKIKLAHNIDDPTKDAMVDRFNGHGSRKIENYTNRIFKPYIDTKLYDWPSQVQRSSSIRLWLETDIISVSELKLRPLDSNPTIVPEGSYFLKRNIGLDDGPPYRRLELNVQDSYYFGGALTWQNAISITGTWGYGDDTASAGTLGTAVSNTTTTSVVVSDGSINSGVGVGDTILIDDEQMLVLDKSNRDSTTVLMTDLEGDIGSYGASVNVSNGGLFKVGETIVIESERMFVIDIAGNILTVQRGYDGTQIATHDSGVSVYIPRTLRVIRGYAGTTAATHTNGTAIYKYTVPEDIEELCISEAIASMMEEDSGYGRETGSESGTRKYSGRSLDSMRKDITLAYGIRRVG